MFEYKYTYVKCTFSLLRGLQTPDFSILVSKKLSALKGTRTPPSKKHWTPGQRQGTEKTVVEYARAVGYRCMESDRIGSREGDMSRSESAHVLRLESFAQHE